MSTQPAAQGNALFPPFRLGQDGRSLSSKGVDLGARGPPSTLPVANYPPGSFTSELRSTTVTAKSELTRPDLGTFVSYRSERSEEKDEKNASERRQAEFRDKIDKEIKIRKGSENLLEALISKNARQTRDQRLQVESELNISNRKIAQLKVDLEAEVQSLKQALANPTSRLSQLFRNAPPRSPLRLDLDEDDYFEAEDTESSTFLLAELLQALEVQGLPHAYYVEQANNLVDLFKRYPTLKYDLVWSIFGLRVQTLLLSDSRELVAAGYRLMRYAMTDRKSLQTMRLLHTDYLVTLSLVKESKASVEREQALKFVRAFLDVNHGAAEISKSVVRVVVAVAEHHDDRMKNICILTLAEILVRNPMLVESAGGMGVLTDAFADGTYQPSESLASAFLYLLDSPSRRINLRSGHELDGPFASFTDVTAHSNEEKLKASARVIAAFLRTWSGLLTWCRNGSLAIKSLIASLYLPSSRTRDIILELIFDVLRIKPPSWSSSFLAGRRLTTYGRVAGMKQAETQLSTGGEEAECKKQDLVAHFISAVLGVFLQSGLVASLLFIISDDSDPSVKRKTTLLLGEVLTMADAMLPKSSSLKMQVLPALFVSALTFNTPGRHVASSTIYQIDSVNRTLYRSGQSNFSRGSDYRAASAGSSLRRPSDLLRGALTSDIEEGHFRSVLLSTQVLGTVNYAKWRWDIIQSIIEGPLLNPKRLDEAIRATKFVKRLMGFYRPFKYRFSEVHNTRPNLRYVRAGCALVRTLLQTAEGVRYLVENKLLRQIAECLAQVDRLSGLTSSSPLFSPDRLSETLCGGYFAILGVASGHSKGLLIMERWKMANMFYHIIELQGRDDLVKVLLSNMDYTLDSHLRIVLSKALTSCSKDVRVFATRILAKYAALEVPISATEGFDTDCAQWAIELAVTQLYDPEIEVCEAAIKTLQEACENADSLEFVVRCRPALDHLGEIGAPLLLRFLSSSVGYHYLDGLDYISQEMDDWFLGRNDGYVSLVEASLARALAGPLEKVPNHIDDPQEQDTYGVAPPHFYRELTRTAEGCKLLESKGHFAEFVAIIRAHGMEDRDSERMLKAKGALWAVGNVGSMELGAPFLEGSNVVELIMHIAEGSEAMSMRGTAFFVLGLISRSVHGQEILTELGWEVATDELGTSLGICLPADFTKLFSVCSARALRQCSTHNYRFRIFQIPMKACEEAKKQEPI